MSASSGQNRVLDHEEIFGEIVSELNESDEAAAAAPPAETAPSESEALDPQVEPAPGAEDPAGESEPPATEKSEPAAASRSGSAAPGDREVACWVDTTLSLVRRSAASAADGPSGALAAAVPRGPDEAARAQEPDSQPPLPEEPRTEVEPPPQAATEPEEAAPGESAETTLQDTGEETPSPAGERTGRFAHWRILVLAILVGLLAGVLAAFVTTRLLHGTWLPDSPQGVVSWSTAGPTAIFSATGIRPVSPSATPFDDRRERASIYSPAPGEAPEPSVEAL